MPIPGNRQRPLEVRSNTQVGMSGPSVTTASGTEDKPYYNTAPAAETSDQMPQAKGYWENHPQGPKVVSQHFSWSALQGSEAPGGMMAGAGGSIGDHQPMPGVVQQNKPPF